MFNPTAILLATLLVLQTSYAQTVQAADGPIVPFTSKLPLCATNCGPLYDVQGKCTPPNIATINQNCFCTDTRLTPFNEAGTAGVAQVCGPTSCTAPADQQTVKSWYQSYCANAAATTTAGATPTDGSSSTSTSNPSSGHKDNSWFATHTRWVIMIIVVFFGIIGIWVAAWYFRKRYIRKRDKAFEMRPPVAWGPHQMQGATGGYNYGDGVTDASRGGRSMGAGGHHKEALAMATPSDATKGKRESKGWLRKNRN